MKDFFIHLFISFKQVYSFTAERAYLGACISSEKQKKSKQNTLHMHGDNVNLIIKLV